MTRFAYKLFVAVELGDDPHKRRSLSLVGEVDADAGDEKAGTFGTAAAIEALQDAAQQAIDAVGKAAKT